MLEFQTSSGISFEFPNRSMDISINMVGKFEELFREFPSWMKDLYTCSTIEQYESRLEAVDVYKLHTEGLDHMRNVCILFCGNQEVFNNPQMVWYFFGKIINDGFNEDIANHSFEQGFECGGRSWYLPPHLNEVGSFRELAELASMFADREKGTIELAPFYASICAILFREHASQVYDKDVFEVRKVFWLNEGTLYHARIACFFLLACFARLNRDILAFSGRIQN